jgi:hypothetical protein
MQIARQPAEAGATSQGVHEREPVLPVRAAPDRHLARPGAGVGGDEGLMRRHLIVELRQIEEHDLGRAEHRRAWQPCRPWCLGLERCEAAVVTHGLRVRR